mmetsp:Transcript_30890/g.77144  ORF Transcript_30890/g.77144 Transcript_30890/m.77144 type:complete len:290 (+) Transcript_30890:22-891(+)
MAVLALLPLLPASLLSFPPASNAGPDARSRLPSRPPHPAGRAPLLPRRALVQHLAFAISAPPAAFAISATTMSGKTKPELGVYLSEAPRVDGRFVSADLVLREGLLATVGFEMDPTFKLQEGGYFDVEASSKEGDNAFVQVAALPRGQSLEQLKPSFLAAAVLGVSGRYGSYGAPVDVKVLAEGSSRGARTVDLAFTALSPGMAEVPRRATLTAVQAGSDVVMLVSGSSSSRWKKSGGEAIARKASASFRVLATRPTALKQEPSADYRYGKTSGPSNMSSRNDGPQYVD